MLAIRFARVGKKNHAQFQMTLQEHTVAPGGHHIEILGSYDPHQKKAVLKKERIEYWISKGATMSDSVYNLLVTNGVVKGEKRKVKLPKKAEAPKTEEAKAEAPKAEEVKEEVKAEEAKVEEKVAEEVKEAKEEAPAEKSA